MFNNRVIRPINVIISLIVLVLFVLGNAGIALSGDPGEQEVTRDLPSIEVTIEKKTPQNVRTASEIFRVTESTKIVNDNGIALDLARLPVPCRAHIAYLKTTGDPEARKIQILKVLPGATTYFPPPTPE